MQGWRKNSLYYLALEAISGNTDTMISTKEIRVDNSKLWHRKLSRISLKGLKVLQKTGKLKIAENIILEPCEECIMGKSSKFPYKSSKYNASYCVEYIHCDIFKR